MQRRERPFDINLKKACLVHEGELYVRATARTSSELSPTMARHEKGVSFWEVESIAKGWKTRELWHITTVSEIEPVHPPSVFICSTSRPPFSISFSRNISS